MGGDRYQSGAGAIATFFAVYICALLVGGAAAVAIVVAIMAATVGLPS